MVFHNAAYAMDWGKSIIYRVNVEGTRNVAEMCSKKGIERIVYTSSAGVYGFPNTQEWITEDSPKKTFERLSKIKTGNGEGVERVQKFTCFYC